MINPLMLLHHQNIAAFCNSVNAAGTIWNFPYTGSILTITLGKGIYKLEVWGALGGSYSSYYGGAGGYSYGTLTLTDKTTTLYVYAGGQPASSTTTGAVTGGFNGGGNGCCRYYSGTYTYGQGGGGGSDIRIGQDSLYARVIVAGGGGGSASVNALTTKYGGGETGGSAVGTYHGSQTKAEIGGGFGYGGSTGSSVTNYKYGAGGGGGGWYGGGASTGYSDSTSAYRNYNGGGSGYVYTSSSSVNYPSGCLLNTSYYLTDAATVKGNIAFKSPTGTNETGHTGNGYCRITCIKGVGVPKPEFVDYIESTGSQFIDTGFKPTQDTRVVANMYLLQNNSSVAANELFGARTSISSKAFAVQYSNSKGGLQYFYGSGYTQVDASFPSTNAICDANKNNLSYSGTEISRTYETFQCDYNLYLFALNNAGTLAFQSIARMYSCQIYDNDTLIRDYVPARQDDIYGLWDKIEKKFYSSASSTQFTGG